METTDVSFPINNRYGIAHGNVLTRNIMENSPDFDGATYPSGRGLVAVRVMLLWCPPYMLLEIDCYRYHVTRRTRRTRLPYATPAGGTFRYCCFDVELVPL
jgi:hypothetical protein